MAKERTVGCRKYSSFLTRQSVLIIKYTGEFSVIEIVVKLVANYTFDEW